MSSTLFQGVYNQNCTQGELHKPKCQLANKYNTGGKRNACKKQSSCFLDQNNLGNCTMCDIIWVIFIGPRSNHCEALFVTASLTDSCCWDLTDVTLAFEESISKLLDIVCVANIEAQEHVDDSLADILKLKFGRHYQRHKWCLDLILCESSCCRY